MIEDAEHKRVVSVGAPHVDMFPKSPRDSHVRPAHVAALVRVGLNAVEPGEVRLAWGWGWARDELR